MEDNKPTIPENELDNGESDYGKNFKSDLSEKEKVGLMETTFQDSKDIKNVIKYPASFLAGKFESLDGFDSRWSSLITNNPLLFEDIDYLRVKQYIDSRITEEEIQAYKSGQLREMYATLENMILCNLKYYDRIISFATMIFMHYVRINDYNYTDGLKNVPIELDMTPTRLWCCALSGTSSTDWEINYAWGVRESVKDKNGNVSIRIKPITIKPIEGSNKSIFEVSYKKIYKNPTFARFVEYSAERNLTTGFQETFFNDTTANEKLAQVCSKFTKSSNALGESQLNTIAEYIEEIELVNNRLYNGIRKCLLKTFNNDESKFNIWIFNEEFYIHTINFSMKVSKANGNITKEYLSNSVECFIAEEQLFPCMREQIEWSKYVIPARFEYDMNILKGLLHEMLKKNYREIICVKRMKNGVVSKIHFTHNFGNVNSNEELIYNNTLLRTNKVCKSKKNISDIIIDRGYYIFGLKEDVDNNFPNEHITTKNIINHYSKYCIKILEHMDNVIFVNNNSKNDIIDVVCKGDINPNRLNNTNIKYTNVTDIKYSSINDDINKTNKVVFKKVSMNEIIYDNERIN